MKTGSNLFTALLLVTQSFALAASESADPELREVHLYSSGVGGFIYEVSITDESVVRLNVPAKDISDVLRSVEVHDPVFPIRFLRVVSSEKEKPLSTIVTSSYIECLLSLRGESIKIQTRDLEEFSGRLVALENSLESFADEMTERTRLTMLIDKSLRTFLLEEIQSLTLQDPLRQKQLDEALSKSNTITSPTATVEIGFAKGKERACRISLFRPMPVWKATYLCNDDQLSLRILVNNTTDEDWNNVKLKIVDGRPVRFFVNVNNAIAVHRKSMSLPVGLPGLPPIFQESTPDPTSQSSDETSASNASSPSIPSRPGGGVPAGLGSEATGLGGFGMGGMALGGGFGGSSGGAAWGEGMGGGMGRMLGSNSPTGSTSSIEPYPSNLSLVTSAPQTREVPSFSLARVAAQQTSSEGTGDDLAINFDSVNISANSIHLLAPQNVNCQSSKLSVFSEDYNESIPLATIRFTNKTNVLYPSGPVSIFENRQFVGEAMLPELSPGKERWVSYGIDRAIRIEVQEAKEESTISKLNFDYEQKQIVVEKLITQVQNYAVENRSSVARALFVERPVYEDWNDEILPSDSIIGSKVRLAVTLPARESVTRRATRKRSKTERLDFASAEIPRIRELLGLEFLTAEQSATLNEIVHRRSQLTAQKSQLALREEGYHDRVRELDRLVRIMSTDGLERDFVRKYATRVEKKEEQIAAFAKEVETLKDAIAANKSFLNPIFDDDDDDDEMYDDDPFSN